MRERWCGKIAAPGSRTEPRRGKGGRSGRGEGPLSPPSRGLLPAPVAGPGRAAGSGAAPAKLGGGWSVVGGGKRTICGVLFLNVLWATTDIRTPPPLPPSRVLISSTFSRNKSLCFNSSRWCLRYQPFTTLQFHGLSPYKSQENS